MDENSRDALASGDCFQPGSRHRHGPAELKLPQPLSATASEPFAAEPQAHI